MENLLKLIIPPKCFFCDKVGDYICAKCLEECELIYETNCFECKKSSCTGCTHTDCQKLTSPDSVISAYNYKAYVRESIKISKYRSKQFCAITKLTQHALEGLDSSGALVDNSLVVVPVPSDKKRLKERGYNLPTLIANIIAHRYKLQKLNNSLIRVRNTAPQYSFKVAERKANISKAFAADERVKDKKVLLVDDIYTSGATLKECAKELKKAGAKEVHCFTLARMRLYETERKNYYNSNDKSNLSTTKNS